MALSIKNIYKNLPPVLESNPKSLELFLNRADLIYTGILPDEKSKAFFLNGIKSCTTGNEKLAIRDLGTYELVRSVLISRIIPKKTVLQRIQDLLNINQFPKESIQNYSDRIRRALYDLNDTYKLRYKEDSSQNLDFLYLMNMRNSLDIFIDGICNQTLRSLVICKDFTNLEEAILYAEEKELQLDIKPCSNQEQLILDQTIHSSKVSRDQKTFNKCPLNKPIFKCGLCFRLNHQSKFCRFIKKSQSLTDFPINKNSKPIFECGKCFRKGHSSPFCRFINNSTVNNINQSSHLRQGSTIIPINGTTNLPLINYSPYIPPLNIADNTFNQQSYLQPNANLNLSANPYGISTNMHDNYFSSFNHTSYKPLNQFREPSRRSGV